MFEGYLYVEGCIVANTLEAVGKAVFPVQGKRQPGPSKRQPGEVTEGMVGIESRFRLADPLPFELVATLDHC